jgi:hypothetical protein
MSDETGYYRFSRQAHMQLVDLKPLQSYTRTVICVVHYKPQEAIFITSITDDISCIFLTLVPCLHHVSSRNFHFLLPDVLSYIFYI